MYTTNLDYVSQRGFEQFIAKDNSIDIMTESARVTFDIEIEARDWGIKSIIPVIYKLDVFIEWRDEEWKRHEYEHTFNEVETDTSISDWWTLTYSDCDIDFESMTASIS